MYVVLPGLATVVHEPDALGTAVHELAGGLRTVLQMVSPVMLVVKSSEPSVYLISTLPADATLIAVTAMLAEP